MQGLKRCLLLLTALLAIIGCAAPPDIPQPVASEPYALVQLPAAMRLLAVDDQTIDARARVREIRVTPGQHALRFVYQAVSPDDSQDHAGQQINPFPLEAKAGVTYVFEAKT